MRIPDWRKLQLSDGVISEPVPEGNRIVLWLPEVRHDGVACRERVATVAGAEISVEQGISAVAATSIRVRRSSFFGRLSRRLRPESGGQTWTLPNGESEEQVGGWRSDLVLTWAEEEAVALNEVRIKSRWAENQGIQKLAENLFLVRGVMSSGPGGSMEAAAPSVAQEPSVQLAEEMLAAARQAGDCRREISALVDLGVTLTGQGSAHRAIVSLEEALTLARQLGDSALESDVLDNLGLALLNAGQAHQALESFRQGIQTARAAGDQFGEKMALMHIGMAFLVIREFAQALNYLNQALMIARQVNDRQHEAELLWQVGMVHAEAGQRDQAIVDAQEAIDLFKQMDNPQADSLKGYLDKYRAGQSSAAELAPSPFFGGQIVAGGPQPGQQFGAGAPRLLRMAFLAMKSMARFAGSGFKPATAGTFRQRLQTCGQCEHHTGLRCRICGCFTKVKAWMPHESCPIGKWEPGLRSAAPADGGPTPRARTVS
jgi:tetratricopeptide (TPR) repeat protein